MSELSPRARELLRSARDLHRPSAADRERIRSALEARLSASALPAHSPSRLRAVRPRWLIASGLVGAGLIGAAFLVASNHEHAKAERRGPPLTSASISALRAAPSAEVPDGLLTPDAELMPAPLAPSPSSSSERRARDQLAAEVRLLARATSDLHAGRPGDALKALDQHQRQFPKGLLGEERRGARAQALCALGRQREGLAELARLRAQSPAAARAKEVCESFR